MNLNSQIRAVLGASLSDEPLETTIRRLDVQGKITQRALLEIILLICAKIQEMEDQPQMKGSPNASKSAV